MNRKQLREKFRSENPDITIRVLPDATLNTWMFDADKEICAITRCIVSNESEVIASVADQQFYDLESEITNFFDIDDLPGGGIYHNQVPLIKATPMEMNRRKRKWKNNPSTDTPRRWWQRGKYLWFDTPLKTADIDIEVDVVLISDDFDGDTKSPYNGLNQLIPYQDGVSKYCQWRAKRKTGNKEDARAAFNEYRGYAKWMKSMVSGNHHASVQMRPSSAYRAVQKTYQ